jgi:Bacterial regulatory proteins, tetR family
MKGRAPVKKRDARSAGNGPSKLHAKRNDRRDLTMRKIAEAIEYAPGTIYLYFENRDAIPASVSI